jgi:hypothetical protein
MPVKLEQAAPVVLRPGDKAPTPPKTGEALSASSTPDLAWTEHKVKRLLVLGLDDMARQFSIPELRATPFELELLPPLLAAYLNRKLPALSAEAANEADERVLLALIGLVVLWMGFKRVIAVQKRRDKDEPRRTAVQETHRDARTAVQGDDSTVVQMHRSAQPATTGGVIDERFFAGAS